MKQRRRRASCAICLSIGDSTLTQPSPLEGEGLAAAFHRLIFSAIALAPSRLSQPADTASLS